jgi:hypothetical protein
MGTKNKGKKSQPTPYVERSAFKIKLTKISSSSKLNLPVNNKIKTEDMELPGILLLRAATSRGSEGETEYPIMFHLLH